MKIFKNPFIRGTFYLTAAGFLSRIIGFFFRIFTAHAFGEEAMGIFQLTAPVIALSYSLCCSGYQTALSKYVAAFEASRNPHNSYKLLGTCIRITLLLSAIFSVIVYTCSDFIALVLLKETRCGALLRILSFSFPLSAIHSCINGYFYGKKRTAFPAFLQLFEQGIRVGSILLLYQLYMQSHQEIPLAVLMVGNVIAEGFVVFVSLSYMFHTLQKQTNAIHRVFHTQKHSLLLFKMAIPLSASRVIVNLLQSVEAVYIPTQLKIYGMTSKEALSTYGVLTGMALSLILFPAAITNSASVMLLPIISENDANKNYTAIARAIKKTMFFCLQMGFASTIFFYCLGPFLGDFLFHSTLAGSYIRGLSFICPFVYLNTTFSSVLNGLARSFVTFSVSITSLLIRIAFVFFLVPHTGIGGYLIGLLISQLSSFLLYLLSLKKYLFVLFSKNVLE